MSKINELIQTLCPDGVEYKKLGELFSFKNGISKNKSFFGHGQPIINFTDVYHHARLYSTMIKGLVDATDSELERFGVCKGDCFFTRTSETKEDIGRASVIIDDIENCVFSGFLIKGHPTTDLLMPEYCSYCFNSGDFRKTIVENANMTTRATITGEILSKIEIPIPPPSVQEEIVRILDEYTNLEAELEAKLSEEIELKQKQYEVYRDELLTFGGDIERKVLSEICDVRDGTHDSPKRSFENDAKYLLTSKNVKNGTICYDSAYKISKNDYDEINKRSIVDVYDLLFTMIGTVGEVGLIIDEPDYAIKNVGLIKTGGDIFLAKFLKYYLTSECVKQYIRENRSKGSQVFLALGKLRMLPVPVLDGAVMDELVSMLDKYDTYTRDMISTLNTELESRKKQYAYYRDQLLTFKRKD